MKIGATVGGFGEFDKTFDLYDELIDAREIKHIEQIGILVMGEMGQNFAEFVMFFFAESLTGTEKQNAKFLFILI